jgi:predicted permease
VIRSEQAIMDSRDSRASSDSRDSGDWKARVRSAFTTPERVPAEDVIEELAQHAQAMYEAGRADGLSHGEAESRVTDQLARWQREAPALSRRPRRPAAPVVVHPLKANGTHLAGLTQLLLVLQEIRYAIRMLASTPGFTLVAALSLALGIGASSAMFSFADALLLRPLPVPEPGAILTVSGGRPDESAYSRGPLSYPNYRDLRERTQSFEGLVAYRLAYVSFARSRRDDREMRMGMLVSDNFFDVFGVQPMLGRRFTPDEGRVPGRDAVVILSHDFWKSSLTGTESILDEKVLINGVEFAVAGVAPPDFTGVHERIRPALYVPLTMAQRLQAAPDDPLEDRNDHLYTVKGRVKPGVSQDRANAEMTALWAALQEQYPETNRNRTVAVRTELERRALEYDPSSARTASLLMALAALVLIIACANVAHLMLGRARARWREIAIRLALGISRTRLLRQLLIESLVLSCAGGAAGVGIAYAGIRVLQTFQVPTDLPIVISPQMDGRVLAFSLLAAILSAVLFGLAPAWQSLRTDPIPGLKSAEPGQTARQRAIGRNVLVVAQVALSMVLLVAAAMLLEGVRRVLHVSPGFRTDGLIMLSTDTSLVRYDAEQTRTFYRDLVERVQQVPGVASAALTSSIPLNPDGYVSHAVVPEGYEFPDGHEAAQVLSAMVDEHYFSTIQTEIVRGRAFTADDRDGTRPVAIVNEQFARIYWPGQDPLGRRLALGPDRTPWLEVVGIARTGRYFLPSEAPTPFLYLPFWQSSPTRMTLLVEAARGDPAALAGPLRQVVRALDEDQPVFNVRTVSDFYERRAIAPQLMMVRTVMAMGLIGSGLALIGLYGLVAYSVAHRTREIGIRMAMGARSSDVLWMVLQRGMRISITGILLGAAASVAASRLLTAGFMHLGAASPLVYVIVPLALIASTTVASYVPARRAARVDPLLAIRDE